LGSIFVLLVIGDYANLGTNAPNPHFYHRGEHQL